MGFYARLQRVSNHFSVSTKRLDHRELVVIVRLLAQPRGPHVRRGIPALRRSQALDDRYLQGKAPSRPCLRRISSVRSNGSASTVWPRPVVVVALNREL